MLLLALDVLAAMFLFVVALLIVVGVIAGVAGIFVGLDNFLSRIFESPREPRPWQLQEIDYARRLAEERRNHEQAPR
jgi:hypothetical protein